jgi:hypothetical protein
MTAEVRLVDADELRRRLVGLGFRSDGLALSTLDAMPSSTAPKGWTRDEVLAELAKHPDNVWEYRDTFTGEWRPLRHLIVEKWHPEVPRTDVRVVRSTPDPEWVPLTKLVGRIPDGQDARVTNYGGNADGPWAQVHMNTIVPLTVNGDGKVAVRPEAAT